MVVMMVFMMGLMFVIVAAVAFLFLLSVFGIFRSMDGKSKRIELEKLKRHQLALGDDGELIELYEDEAPLLYTGKERQ